MTPSSPSVPAGLQPAAAPRDRGAPVGSTGVGARATARPLLLACARYERARAQRRAMTSGLAVGSAFPALSLAWSAAVPPTARTVAFAVWLAVLVLAMRAGFSEARCHRRFTTEGETFE